MLTRLLPDQISKFWDVIKYAIEESLPPIVGDHPDKMNRILTSTLSGSTDVWASHEKQEDINKFEGIVLTRILYDDASDTRNLLIYCLYGYDLVSNRSWLEGLMTILRYAEGKHCAQIIAYTEIPHIIELVKKLGGKATYTFISFNVNETVRKFNELGVDYANNIHEG